MAKVVLDARGGALTRELPERCRLTGVPLVLAYCDGSGIASKVALAVCRAPRLSSGDGFKLIQRCVSNASREAAEQIKHMVSTGDVVVTDDVLVAAKAIEGGAVAFNVSGWQYEYERACAGAREREQMRAEGKLDAFRAMCRKSPRTPETMGLLYDGISGVIPQFAETARLPSIPGARIIVDADNAVCSPALVSARAHDIPVVLVHDNSRSFGRAILLSDSTAPCESGGVWVCDITVRPGENAADNRIADIAQPGDVVLTDDVLLRRRCLLAGAVVVDHSGARFYPEDVAGKKASKRAFRVLSRARCREAKMRYRGYDRDYVVVDALEAVLGGVRPLQTRERPLPYGFDYNAPISFVPGMARTLGEASAAYV